MSQSVSNVLVHIVHSTNNRKAFLSDESIRKEMHAMLASVYNDLQCPALVVGGTEDHIHVLSKLHRTKKLSDVIGETKRETSIWAKDEGGLDEFSWQAGYGAFSVGQMETDLVHQYIRRQPQRHQKVTFKDEFRKLLDKYGIDYDEEYVWD